jgi:hypothetical protein
MSHPITLAFALWRAASFHLLRREEQFALERPEALLALFAEQGFPEFLARGTFSRVGALAAQGQKKEGIAQMCQGQNRWFLPVLAEAYGKEGQVEEGLTVLAEALAQVDKTGERVSEAELYRTKGTLTLQKFQVSSCRLKKV